MKEDGAEESVGHQLDKQGNFAQAQGSQNIEKKLDLSDCQILATPSKFKIKIKIDSPKQSPKIVLKFGDKLDRNSGSVARTKRELSSAVTNDTQDQPSTVTTSKTDKSLSSNDTTKIIPRTMTTRSIAKAAAGSKQRDFNGDVLAPANKHGEVYESMKASQLKAAKKIDHLGPVDTKELQNSPLRDDKVEKQRSRVKNQKPQSSYKSRAANSSDVSSPIPTTKISRKNLEKTFEELDGSLALADLPSAEASSSPSVSALIANAKWDAGILGNSLFKSKISPQEIWKANYKTASQSELPTAFEMVRAEAQHWHAEFGKQKKQMQGLENQNEMLQKMNAKLQANAKKVQRRLDEANLAHKEASAKKNDLLQTKNKKIKDLNERAKKLEGREQLLERLLRDLTEGKTTNEGVKELLAGGDSDREVQIDGVKECQGDVLPTANEQEYEIAIEIADVKSIESETLSNVLRSQKRGREDEDEIDSAGVKKMKLESLI